jgi:hypothetical protein
MRGDGKREKGDEERAKTGQEMRLRCESEDQTTLAPEAQWVVCSISRG